MWIRLSGPSALPGTCASMHGWYGPTPVEQSSISSTVGLFWYAEQSLRRTTMRRKWLTWSKPLIPSVCQ